MRFVVSLVLLLLAPATAAGQPGSKTPSGQKWVVA